MKKRYTTLKDIAKALGVSVTTVHKALNGHPDVSEETRKRVLEVTEKLGYIKNETASNLRTSGSNTIAFISSNISNPFYEQVIKGMNQAAEDFGYMLLITNLINDSRDDLVRSIEILMKKRIDGLIIAANMLALNHQDLRKYKIREFCVAFGTVFPPEEFDVVSPNNFKGGYIATKHLIESGCKKIAMLHSSNFEIEKNLNERFKGYLRALQDHNIEFSQELLFIQKQFMSKSYGTQSAYKILKEKLKTTQFDGLFCYNDETAYGAIEAIKESGLRIPEDIAVVGYDNLEFSRMISPQLTSITFDKYKLGYKAVEMLLERINHPELNPRIELIDVKIVVRESSKGGIKGGIR
ncbi:LacI family DNA-binding transcriptional regulator [Pseudothermotoga elfii]